LGRRWSPETRSWKITRRTRQGPSFPGLGRVGANHRLVSSTSHLRCIADMRHLTLCRACARRSSILRRMYSSVNHTRDYNGAVQALNSLQSNFSIVEAIRKMGPGWNKLAIPEMVGWVKRIGYEVCVSRDVL